MSMHGHLAAAAAVIERADQPAVPEDQTVPSSHCSPMSLNRPEEVRSSSIPDKHAKVSDIGFVESSSMTLVRHLK
jgi:hypothetical protein